LADPAPRTVILRQQRVDIPADTLLRDAISPRGETVDFQGRAMHITAWSRRFLFKDAQLLQAVGQLSGGERARAHIARMMLEPADILVLDEPTNDLDIPTLEVLEDAIESFPGAVLLVTHDRAMLERLAERIVVIGAPDASVSVVASLEQALAALERAERGAQERERAASPAKTKPVESKPAAPARKRLGFKEQRELEGMEAAIEAAERAQTKAEAKVADPATAADHVKMAAACEALGRAQAEVARLYARWQELESLRTPAGP
jgi:ATP-binding cassette subfamily F protein uup